MKRPEFKSLPFPVKSVTIDFKELMALYETVGMLRKEVDESWKRIDELGKDCGDSDEQMMGILNIEAVASLKLARISQALDLNGVRAPCKCQHHMQNCEARGILAEPVKYGLMVDGELAEVEVNPEGMDRITMRVEDSSPLAQLHNGKAVTAVLFTNG